MGSAGASTSSPPSSPVYTASPLPGLQGGRSVPFLVGVAGCSSPSSGTQAAAASSSLGGIGEAQEKGQHDTLPSGPSHQRLEGDRKRGRCGAGTIAILGRAEAGCVERARWSGSIPRERWWS